MDEPKKLPSIRTLVKDQKKVKGGNSHSKTSNEAISAILKTTETKKISIPKPPVKKVSTRKITETNTSKTEIPKPPVKKSIPKPPKANSKTTDTAPIREKEVVKTEPKITVPPIKKEVKEPIPETHPTLKKEIKESVETQVSLYEKNNIKKAKPKRTTKSSLFAGPATIITDTKKDRFRLFPAIGDSLKEWFENNKKNFLTKKTPKYTVPETTRRKGVIQKATSKTGTFVASDHSLIYKRIKERDRETKERTVGDVRNNNITNVKVIKKKTVANTEEHKPQTTWSNHIESVFPLLNEGEVNRTKKYSHKNFLTANQEIVVTDLKKVNQPEKENIPEKIGWETATENKQQKNVATEHKPETKNEEASAEHVSTDLSQIKSPLKSKDTTALSTKAMDVSDAVPSRTETEETTDVKPVSPTTTDNIPNPTETTTPTQPSNNNSNESSQIAETEKIVSQATQPDTNTAPVPQANLTLPEKPLSEDPSLINTPTETPTTDQESASTIKNPENTEGSAWSTEEVALQTEPTQEESLTQTSPSPNASQTPITEPVSTPTPTETQTALSQDEILKNKRKVPDSIWVTATPPQNIPETPEAINQSNAPSNSSATKNTSAWSTPAPTPSPEAVASATPQTNTKETIPTTYPQPTPQTVAPSFPSEINNQPDTVPPAIQETRAQTIPTPEMTAPETIPTTNDPALSKVEQKEKPTLRSLLYSVNINVLVFGVFFLIIIISLLVLFYIKLSGNEDIKPIKTEPITEQPFLIEAPLKIVHLPNPKSETIISTIKDLRNDRSVAVTQLAFGATEDNKTLVPPSDILSALGAELETNFLQSITHIYFGYTQSGSDLEPYIALRVNDGTVARGGMFVWEENMYNDLEPIFASNMAEGITLPEVELKFIDAVLGGVDLRLLEDVDGNERIIYGPINTNTIIITTDSLTFSKLSK